MRISVNNFARLADAFREDEGEPIKYLDHLPSGWFALAVIREGERGGNWTALLVDVNPDELKTCKCQFPALFYVDPKDYKPGPREAHQGWFRIPGKFRSRDSAWDALEEMMVIKH